MKFIVSSSLLLKNIQVLGGILNTNNTLPILDYFLFKISKNILRITSSIKSKYKRFLKTNENPFFNALQVKFSYAITCHKAQGGQWPVVFLEKPYLKEGPNIDYFRWLYTAVTRAERKLYLIGF